MDINWLSLIVPALMAIIVAVLANVIPQWIQKWRSPEEEEKDRATAAGVISEASIRMVQQWQARVETLETKVQKYAEKVEIQAAEIAQLKTQVAEQEQRIDELEKENRSLMIENNSLTATSEVFKKGASKLEEQVIDLGHLPIWTH